MTTEVLTDQPSISNYSKEHKPIACHFTDRILPQGVTILNKENTHFQSGHPPSTIDHITSTHPAQISNVTTINNGLSDHAILSCNRLTKAPIIQPTYRNIRDYKNIDKMEMSTMLRLSEDIRAASIEQDPTEASILLNRGIITVLDSLAPIHRIQTRSNMAPYVSHKSRNLQQQREEAYQRARMTGHPDHWRQYRHIRNQTTQSIRNDHYNYTKEKVQDKGPREMWSRVKQMTGKSTSGPPTQLAVSGSLITSPKKITQEINDFYINKVQQIRANIPAAIVDPLAAIKRMLQGKI